MRTAQGPQGVIKLAPARAAQPLAFYVHRVCRQVAAARGVALVRYPIHIWHHVLPETLRGIRWGTFALSTDAQQAKTRAIQCYRTPLGFQTHNLDVPASLLTYFSRPYEAFVL